MKRFLRIVSVVLIIITFTQLFSFAAASDSVAVQQTPHSTSPFYNIECIYDSSNASIKIAFRMRSDDVKKYGESKISIYRIHPDQTPDVINFEDVYVAANDISPSNRSDILIKSVDLEARLSQYIIAIDHKGEKICSKPFYAFVQGNSTNGGFKGIESNNASISVETHPDVCIQEVKIDKLESTGGGYLYYTDKKTYTFSKEYLSEIDRNVKNYSDAGALVYIRLTDNSNNVFFDGSFQSAFSVYAYVSFLCERYVSDENGGVAGFILGDSEISHSAAEAQKHSGVLYSAAAAVLDSNKKCGVIVPVSENLNNTKDFLAGICNEFESSVSNAFTVMLESTINPYRIDRTHTNRYDEYENYKPSEEENNHENDDAIFSPTDEELPLLKPITDADGIISAENISTLTSYIHSLSSLSECFSSSVMYEWTPTQIGTSGNAALASYVYNYCKLMFSSNVSGFLLKLPEDLDRDSLSVLTSAVSCADTDKFDRMVDLGKMARYFGEESFETLVYGFTASKLQKRALYIQAVIKNEPYNIFGSCNYFDFSETSKINDWKNGWGCSVIYSNKTPDGRSLGAKMHSESGSSSFIYYNYKYEESFKYTDYIALNFSIESDDPNAIFNLEAIIGGDGFTGEYVSYTYFSDHIYTVYLDTSALTEQQTANFIRLSFSPQADKTVDYKVFIHSVDAHSRTYNSEELSELIEAERERLKSSADANEKRKVDTNAIILICFVVVATLMAMVMISRRRNIIITQTGKDFEEKKK